MHNIFRLWVRLLVWLNEGDDGSEVKSPVFFDADLPTYHPLSD
jgi:hypothetical protein